MEISEVKVPGTVPVPGRVIYNFKVIKKRLKEIVPFKRPQRIQGAI